MDECAKQHQPLYGDGRSSVARAVGYLIERGRCLSRLTTSHHTLRLAYRRVSLSSLCVPCCGWRPVSECTPLLLSRRLLFKYTPLSAAGAAPDVARPANRAPAVPPLVPRPTNRATAPTRPTALPVCSVNRMSSDRAWRVTAFSPPTPYATAERSVIRACTMARTHEIEPAVRNWLAQFHARRPAPRRCRAVPCRAAPCRAVPRRAAPCRIKPGRDGRAAARLGRSSLSCHVVRHAFDNRHLHPCVRTWRALTRLLSQNDFRRRAFSLRPIDRYPCFVFFSFFLRLTAPGSSNSNAWIGIETTPVSVSLICKCIWRVRGEVFAIVSDGENVAKKTVDPRGSPWNHHDRKFGIQRGEHKYNVICISLFIVVVNQSFYVLLFIHLLMFLLYSKFYIIRFIIIRLIYYYIFIRLLIWKSCALRHFYLDICNYKSSNNCFQKLHGKNLK